MTLKILENFKIFLFILTILVVGLLCFYLFSYYQQSLLLKPYKDIDKGLIDDSNKELFIEKIPFFTAYNQGEETAYWYLGQTKRNVNYIYYFKDHNDKIIIEQHPVIAHIPGDKNYSGFWQIIFVRVPRGYKTNWIKNEQTILQGVENDVFKLKQTKQAVNMPVVAHQVVIENKKDNYPILKKGWYNGYEVSLVEFETGLAMDNKDDLVALPLIAIFREGDLNPLFELFVNQDLNNDDDLNDSFNLLEKSLNTSNYSPLAQLNYIYVYFTYPTLEQEAPPWTSIEDLVTNKGKYINFEKGKAGLKETEVLINIPQIP